MRPSGGDHERRSGHQSRSTPRRLESCHSHCALAMAAAALSMGARTTAELRRGSLEQVLVKGDSGYVVIIAAGKETVLAAISNGEAKLGMILYEMKLAARDLARELG